MPLDNPHRNYDKGMDDAYMGREPQSNSGQYMEGYSRSWYLLNEDQNKEQPVQIQEYNGIVCPHCGCETGIEPALVEPDAPMIYCPECDEPLFNTEQ